MPRTRPQAELVNGSPNVSTKNNVGSAHGIDQADLLSWILSIHAAMPLPTRQRAIMYISLPVSTCLSHLLHDLGPRPRRQRHQSASRDAEANCEHPARAHGVRPCLRRRRLLIFLSRLGLWPRPSLQLSMRRSCCHAGQRKATRSPAPDSSGLVSRRDESNLLSYHQR